MFGIEKLKQSLKALEVTMNGDQSRMNWIYSHTTDRLDEHSAAVTQLTSQIEELRKQLKRLASVLDCTISEPTPAKAGGEVRKLTPEEIASQDMWRTFSVSPFFPHNLERPPKMDVSKRTTKKTTKKKK